MQGRSLLGVSFTCAAHLAELVALAALGAQKQAATQIGTSHRLGRRLIDRVMNPPPCGRWAVPQHPEAVKNG
jgi:hypothetical protein